MLTSLALPCNGGFHTVGGPCVNTRIFLCTPLDPIDSIG